MRIESNQSVSYLNGEETTNTAQKKNKDLKVYAGDLTLGMNVDKKKKQAQSMAMQLLETVFSNDKKMDSDADARSQHVKELYDQNADYREQLRRLSQRKEQTKKDYGIDEDTPLSEEAAKSYEKDMAMFAEAEKAIMMKIQENDKLIHQEISIVNGMAIERLKTHEMVDAQKQGEKLKEAASKEVIGMLTEEAKDHIDEKQEEMEEEADKIEEKEQELEEKIQDAKKLEAERRKDEEEHLYDLSSTMDEIKTGSQKDVMPDVKKSLDQMVNELMITSEDLKGAAVDAEV